MFLINAFLCLLGLSYGSFVGSYIIRFPRMIDSESGVTIYSPRSRCETCGKNLKYYMLIPLLSFLLQRGKCTFCKKSISPFYFCNEILHLLLMALIVWSNLFPTLIESILFFLVVSSLYAQFIIDFKYLSLSVYLSIQVLILGLILNSGQGLFTDLQSSLIGVLVGYFSLYLINKIYFLLRKKEGIGGGDFILLASIGALLGYQMLSFVILLGSLLSLQIYVFKRSDYKGRVPFGSGLALSALLIIAIQIFYS